MEKINEKDKTLKIKNLIKMKDYYSKHIKLILGIVFLSAIYSGVAFLGPMFEGQMFAKITALDFKGIITFALLLSIVQIIKTYVSTFWTRVGVELNSRVQVSLTQKIVGSLLQIKVKKYDTINSGSFITRISKDVGLLSEFLDNLIDDLSTIIMNAAFLIYIFVANVWIGLYVAVNLIVIYFYNSYELKVGKTLKRIYREKEDSKVGVLSEGIRGVRDVKNLNAYDSMERIVDQSSTDAINAHKKQTNKRRLLSSIRETIRQVFNFGFYALGALFLFKGQLDAAAFFTLLIYKRNTGSLIGAIASLRSWFIEAELSAERVFDVIESDVYEKEEYGNKQIERLDGSIEFENVDFGYKEEELLFKNLSFKIMPNTLNAFVGKSGEGKSTIINLIAKNYDIQGGDIKFSGHSIKDLSKQTLKKNIAVVPQNPYLFNMTIKENLRLANPSATDKQIIDACKKANIHDFIVSKPKAYDEIIGENGVQLSGGQRQRLAIARALLQNAGIILFDEATSALDNKSQNSIKKVIKKLSKDHTIIVVAHRLSTIYDADTIFVIDKHKIIAKGPHKQLLEKNKVYQKLYLAEEENS